MLKIAEMKEAWFYETTKNSRISCFLCPQNCRISEGKRGVCNVRINIGGRLYSEVYNRPVALHSDPVEKKPLYHFFPGSQILSIGTAGCNMKCFYCQNCDISQRSVDQFNSLKRINSGELIEMSTTSPNNLGVAYTYNEPTIYFEYMYDIAKGIREKGQKNVVVTNGFINPEPLSLLLEVSDAFNVDLKAFDDEFYRKHTSSRLAPVLETIKTIVKAGKHLEITNLVIPGLNDDAEEFTEMVKWIKQETSENTVLHLSRYFPRYKSKISSTSENLLEYFYHLAGEQLNYVYLGNMYSDKGKDTFCHHCGNMVISRNGYSVSLKGVNSKGECDNCGTKIITDI